MATPTLAIHLLKGQTPPKGEGGEKQSLGWHLAWWLEEVRAQLPWAPSGWAGRAGTRPYSPGFGWEKKGEEREQSQAVDGPGVGAQSPRPALEQLELSSSCSSWN